MSSFKDRAGFSLVEVMVTLGIFTILMGGVYSVLLMSDSATRTGLTNIELAQDVRLGIDRMVKELRNVQSSTVDIPSAGVITFHVAGNPHVIQYSLGASPDEKTLYRSAAGASTVLCHNIKSIQFSFSGKIVTIALEVEKISALRRNLTTALNIDVKVRN